MTRDNPQERRERRKHHHGRAFMFIPAGTLIGLGIGLLAGYPGSGVLIGLGLGFIGMALMKTRAPPEAGDTTQGYYRRSSPIILALIGIFMICLGIGIVWTPLTLWPILAALFLILLGIRILYRGFSTVTKKISVFFNGRVALPPALCIYHKKKDTRF